MFLAHNTERLARYNRTFIQMEERAGEQLGAVAVADHGHDLYIMDNPVPFKDVIRRIDSYSTKCWVYLSEEESWKPESPCLVLQSDEVPPEEEDDPDAGVPEIAKKLKMMQTVTVAEVQDIVANCKMQKSDASDETLFEAFIYYYDNDAYIEIA